MSTVIYAVTLDMRCVPTSKVEIDKNKVVPLKKGERKYKNLRVSNTLIWFNGNLFKFSKDGKSLVNKKGEGINISKFMNKVFVSEYIGNSKSSVRVYTCK